jgi:hypothetical protein
VTSSSSVTICVPVYKDSLSEQEAKGLRYSLRFFDKDQVRFVAPVTLPTSFYESQFPGVDFLFFPETFFQSERTYSQLLLSLDFYRTITSKFLLILQTDALIFSNALGYWIDQDYDYIGAPWAGGIDFAFPALTPNLPAGGSIRPSVGNGGLSLRKVSTMVDVLQKFPVQAEIWKGVGNPEDVFLGMALQILPDARLPNLYTAALFSIETLPSFYLSLINGSVPFGCHAYDKYELELWKSQAFWPKELQ